MMKMVIEFDIKKIIEEGMLTEDVLFRNIERAINKFGLTKVDKGVYMDSGNPKDLTHFMSIMGWLQQSEWFLRYAKRWEWFNDFHGTRKNRVPEDLLEEI